MRISRLLILAAAAIAGTLVYKARHPSPSTQAEGSSGLYDSLTGPGSLFQTYHDAKAGKSDFSLAGSLGSNDGGIGAIGPNTTKRGAFDTDDSDDASASLPNDDGELIIAAAKGNEQEVTGRLAAHAKVDSRDAQDRTALMYASWNGNDAICARLLAAGASLNEKDNNDYNALDYAASRGLVETVQTLLKYGHARDNRHYIEYATLIRAAYAGTTSAMPPGTDDLASINRISPEGQAPLFIAAGNGSAALVEAMIARGANVNLENNLKQTPLHWAAWDNQPQTIALLIARGATISSRDLSGNTPLMLAAQNGSRAAAQMLISKGADKYLTNQNNETAGMIAGDKGHKDLAALLQ